MESDLGKSSLAVLLVLALLVSVITTFLVLDAVVSPVSEQPDVKLTQTSEGSVRLAIERPETVTQQASVTLSIQR
jgi:hypothetical protein